MAFLITGTLFSNESSQGFRRMRSHGGEALAGFQLVEDLKDITPFEGVTNHPTLMILKRSETTKYPIPYVIWHFKDGKRPPVGEVADFIEAAVPEHLLAAPVPGTDAGPWLRGSEEEHRLWEEIFDGSSASHYRARKGVTTDLNGAYFVRTKPGSNGLVTIENDPAVGRTPGLPAVTQDVEPDHIFPLVRGRGVSRFRAILDANYSILVPQRGMHGDPGLPATAPKTLAYLANFQPKLSERGSYRRYQKSQPYWSLWSTGPYTFAPFKVLWKEMGGSRFAAAYVSSSQTAGGFEKPVIPDHKLYFVPVETKAEAEFLVAILNAKSISHAVSSYAAQLSLGVSVIEYLNIPEFDPQNSEHTRLVELAAQAVRSDGVLSDVEEAELDRIAIKVVSAR